MWVLIAFIAIPLIEISLFIQVGGYLTLWPTLAIVLFTAILGSTLVRTQGAATLQELQKSFSTMRDPAQPMAHGAMILVAGVLLITPGFLTDTVGLLLMVPAVRQAVYKWAAARIKLQTFGSVHMNNRSAAFDDTIEGEYREVKLDDSFIPSSKWKH